MASSTAFSVNSKIDKKFVTLTCPDGVSFDVDLDVIVKYSQTLRDLVEDCGEGVDNIPVDMISSNDLAKILEYLNGRADIDNTSSSEENRQTFDNQFVESLSGKPEMPRLFSVLNGANFLNCNELMDLMCNTVANMIKGKTPEEIRETFDIKNDITKEEDEKIRKENAWAFGDTL
jgi:S-phase kinase-associated protein 1